VQYRVVAGHGRVVYPGVCRGVYTMVGIPAYTRVGIQAYTSHLRINPGLRRVLASFSQVSQGGWKALFRSFPLFSAQNSDIPEVKTT